MSKCKICGMKLSPGYKACRDPMCPSQVDKDGKIELSQKQFESATSLPEARIVGTTEGGISYRLGKDLLFHNSDSNTYHKIPGFYR